MRNTLPLVLLLSFLVACELPMTAELNDPLDANSAAGSSTKLLRDFSFEPGPGSGTNPAASARATIADDAVSVVVPSGTDLKSLVATFTYAGAAIKVAGVAQASGVSKNDFTSPVTYTVYATDGSKADYVVTVSRGSAGGGSSTETVSTSVPSAVTVTLSESSTVSWTLASGSSKVVSITAPTAPTVVGWYLDGVLVSNSAGLTSLSINTAASPLAAGPHTLMAVVASQGQWYSATTQFTVNEGA